MKLVCDPSWLGKGALVRNLRCFGQEFEPVYLFIFEYTLISTFKSR